MIRLRVREYVAENAPELNRYDLGRRAGVSNTYMNSIWRKPERTHLYLDYLDRIAQALSDYLQKEVTVCDLIQSTNIPHPSNFS